MKLNTENIKNSKKSLTVMLISITLLILFNAVVSNIKPSEAQLTDEEIEIHKLVINEIMTSNKGVVIDPSGNSYDWIELYNGSSKNIDLTNYGLSDKEDGAIKWLFPHVTIPSNSYLIVYLSGEKSDGLYANFALKSEGDELLTLKNGSGKVVDTVRTVELKKNTTMARDGQGNWITTEEITPGFQNNEEGRKEYLSGSKGLNGASPLVLTEFLPANEGNVIFNGDKLYSYIEVTNEGEEPVNLSEYYLSNDIKTVYKYRLPEINLAPGDSYLVFTNELDNDNNANFRLKHHTGTVVLSDRYSIIEEVKYEELTNGMAYVKMNNRWHQTGNISPGYPNTSGGKVKFQEKYDIPKKDIIISEIMSSNGKYLPQNGNQFYDWIELYNNSNFPINLSTYTLSTDYDDKKMYTLPNITLSSKEYIVIMASGDTSLSNNNYTHTNFKLSSGNGLFLFNNNETLIDSLYIYSIPRESSYGRGASNGHYYYTSPTPKYANDSNGIREISYNPTFDTEGGIYDGVSSLEVKIEGSGTIYYTTDGSVPNTNSKKYTEPITLTNSTVIRAVSYEKNKKNSDVITNSYIINEYHTIPVMSVSLPDSKFQSIYSNNYGHSTASAHVELYEEDTSFSVDCGFKLFGGQSRELPKKSFALKFNSNYSGGKLHYKVFDNKDLVEFNTLVLRSGSQDQNSTMIRDEFNSTMLINYGTIDAQAVKPIVLYINGNYWGVYYIREKIDADFIENNYNVGGTTNIANYKLAKEEGSNSKIMNLKNFVLKNDLSEEENYNYVSSQMDLQNYADYWAYLFLANSTDLHNMRYYNNPNVGGGKIRMIIYDTDYSFYVQTLSYISFMKNPSFLAAPPDTTFITALLRVPEFEQLFIERISYYLKYVWTDEHINDTYTYLYESIAPEMKRNCERWGTDYNSWLSSIKRLKTTILSRGNAVRKATSNYFNLSEEEYDKYFA